MIHGRTWLVPLHALVNSPERRDIAHRSGASGPAAARPAEELARHLLGVLMGLRVLARVRPERALLTGVVAPSMALLDPRGGEA